jgi:hypothetical protein
MIMIGSKPLAVLPSLPVRVKPSGRIAITQKFAEGMRRDVEE